MPSMASIQTGIAVFTLRISFLCTATSILDSPRTLMPDLYHWLRSTDREQIKRGIQRLLDTGLGGDAGT